MTARRTILLVESHGALAEIVRRTFGDRPVSIAASVSRAVRELESDPRIGVVVSNYRLRDGTAGKLFSIASRRWPGVQRVMYADGPRPNTEAARLAVQLANAVAADFEELRRLVQ